ncbi:hypothetical protein CMV_016616 [Castanea mollissima]|uniref:Uncharacterized protein n=1 Tax=Castanea mollissima TaxID=60419 RepID=A0A8J4R3L7_9ROSI|nr:hypothetical protein CMV_016616 [Castanea mollissima]
MNSFQTVSQGVHDDRGEAVYLAGDGASGESVRGAQSGANGFVDGDQVGVPEPGQDVPSGRHDPTTPPPPRRRQGGNRVGLRIGRQRFHRDSQRVHDALRSGGACALRSLLGEHHFPVQQPEGTFWVWHRIQILSSKSDRILHDSKMGNRILRSQIL